MNTLIAAKNHVVHMPRRCALTAAAATALAATSGTVWAAAVQSSQVGASLPVVRFDTGASAASEAWSRASGFASVLTGEKVLPTRGKVQIPAARTQFHVETRDGVRYMAEAQPPGAVHVHAGVADAEVAAQAGFAAVPADPRAKPVRILVDSERRDILAVNGAIADDSHSAPDVGPERARLVFEAACQSLIAGQLVANDILTTQASRTSRVMQGEQARGGPATTRVKEYLYEVPHAISGIEIFGAATTVAVHRSGKLASIRSIGPAATLAADRSTVTRFISAEALADRARSEYPNAKVKPLGLRYPWQATSDADLASRPREAFQVTPLAQIEGRQIEGRAHYVFYSLEGDHVAPIIWPVPKPHAAGDVRK